jgi:hypothetical protein
MKKKPKALSSTIETEFMVITMTTLGRFNTEPEILAEKISKGLTPYLDSLDKSGWDFNKLIGYDSFFEFMEKTNFSMHTELVMLFRTLEFPNEMIMNISVQLKKPKAGIKVLTSDGIIFTSQCISDLCSGGNNTDLSPIGFSPKGCFYEDTTKNKIVRGVGLYWDLTCLCEVSDLYGDPRTVDWLLDIIKSDIEE